MRDFLVPAKGILRGPDVPAFHTSLALLSNRQSVQPGSPCFPGVGVGSAEGFPWTAATALVFSSLIPPCHLPPPALIAVCPRVVVPPSGAGKEWTME